MDFVPTDSDMDEELDPPGGADSDVGLMFGVPNQASLMSLYARHALRFCMVAPNSSRVPSQIFVWAKSGKAELLSPSAWGVNTIRAQEPDVTVSLLPHGVPSAWATLPLLARERRTDGLDPWRVLHVTSTASDRKSTMECIRAFSRVQRTGCIPSSARLTVHADERSGALLERMMAREGYPPAREQKEGDARIVLTDGRTLDWADWPTYVRNFDLVLQPSRAEGFGLVPLEALCLGVPVCATLCTGHDAFLKMLTPGLVPVAHGPDDEIEDGEGALAPTVDEGDIASAIVRAYVRRQALAEEAALFAPEMARTWAWRAIMKQWLDDEVSPRIG